MKHSNSYKENSLKGRRAIIQILKTDGAMTAQAISDQLGVTAMAVRQHLYDLEEQGVVSFEEKGQGAGRPSKHWHLTPEANKFFPDGHADLAVGLIHTVRAAFGEDGIQQLVAVRTKTQQTTYSRKMKHCGNIREKLDTLANIRNDEGYMAEVETLPGGDFMFLERHCPICSAASVCSGLCSSELDVFRNVLGDDVHVERSDHILAGARRCAYRIHPLED